MSFVKKSESFVYGVMSIRQHLNWDGETFQRFVNDELIEINEEQEKFFIETDLGKASGVIVEAPKKKKKEIENADSN